MTLPASLRAEADRPFAPGVNAYYHDEPTRALLHRAADALEALEGAERTIITKQRDGTNPLRDNWAAFDETPGYIISDPVAVAAIDAMLPLPATPEGG